MCSCIGCKRYRNEELQSYVVFCSYCNQILVIGDWGSRGILLRKGMRYGCAQSLSSLCPIPRRIDGEVQKMYPSLTWMLCNSRSFNKTATVQCNFAEQQVALACLTKILVMEIMEGEILPGFSVLHQN